MLRFNSPQFVTYTSVHIRSTENNKNNHERHILTEGLRQKVLHGLRWAWKHAPSWWDRNWNHPPQAFLPVPDDSRCAINISTYPHTVISTYQPVIHFICHMPEFMTWILGNPGSLGAFIANWKKRKNVQSVDFINGFSNLFSPKMESITINYKNVLTRVNCLLYHFLCKRAFLGSNLSFCTPNGPKRAERLLGQVA